MKINSNLTEETKGNIPINDSVNRQGQIDNQLHLQDYMIQQGWQCPICKTIYSPIIPSCFRCSRENENDIAKHWVKTSDSTGQPIKPSTTITSTTYSNYKDCDIDK